MLFSVASVLFSCGNIINETVLAHDENSHSIDEDDNSGIVFTEMNRIFSTSGDIRIEKTGDEGYCIAGTVDEETSDNVWFSVIGKNGILKNETILRSGYDDRVRRVKVLDNENIIIFADRYYDNGDIDLIIAKVNRKTGIIWDYCFGDESKNRIFDVTVADDGGMLITGLSYYQLLGTMQYITFALKVDDSGRSVWKKDYRSLFSVFMPSEIRKTGQGVYLVSGLCLNRLTNKFKTFFTRIDGEGNVISSVFINVAGKHTMLIGTSIGENNDFTGIISLTGGSYADGIVIAGFDDRLNVLYLKEYCFPDFNVRGKYIRGSDGGIIVAGMLNNNAGNGLYFLRLSSRGIIQDLAIKNYDSDDYDLSDVYFNAEESDDGLIYLCRYNNINTSFPDGRLFLDRFKPISFYRSSVNEISRSAETEVIDYETGAVELQSEGSSLMEKGRASLSFVQN